MSALLPVGALLLNATVWGLSWLGFQSLQARGLHSLWATAIIYSLAMLSLASLRPAALKELLGTAKLWWIVLAAGLTNACFNTAVASGDVVRVVLLFYLMPLWSLLLASPLLGEKISRSGLIRVAIGLAGAMLVLYQPGGGPPIPRSWIEILALCGGAAFAFNNILLRKYRHSSETSRTLAMFVGGALLALLAAIALSAAQIISWPASPKNLPQLASTIPTLLLWSGLFLIANGALQYGVARVSASRTAVIMLSEILVAAASAWWLGQAQIQAHEIIGGCLIIAAPWLSREAAGRH